MSEQTLYMTRHAGEAILLSFEYNYHPWFYQIDFGKKTLEGQPIYLNTFQKTLPIRVENEIGMEMDILTPEKNKLIILAPFKLAYQQEITRFEISVDNWEKNLFKIHQVGNLSAMQVHRKEIWLPIRQGVDFDNFKAESKVA